MNAANICAEAGRVGVFGDRNKDLDIVGCGAAFELRTRLKISYVNTPLVTES